MNCSGCGKHSKQRGGFKDALPNQSDLQVFYNEFMNRAGTENQDVLTTSEEKATSHSLFVIDMQNDFTNPYLPPEYDTDPNGNRSGAFSVADGNLMAPELFNFINQHSAKFTKIIFSRDTHDENHCSFAGDNGSNGGIFPTHCVINTEGAGLYRDKVKNANDFRTFHTLSNADVIFKGMHPNVESYGAMKYDGSNDYITRRQSGKKCCTKGRTGVNGAKNNNENYKCSNATGGYYLKNKDKVNAFSDQPFTKQNAKTFQEIKNDFEKRFDVKDLLGDAPGAVHNIYVCGLAGDFCVKDTAYNIMNATKGKIGETKINVYVIHPFCRYACLPINLPHPVDPKTLAPLPRNAGVFKSMEKNKPLYNYVIKADLGPPFTKSLMRPEAIVNELTYEGEPTFGAIPGAQYQHFLTDPRDLLKDYKTAGVQVLMTLPTFAPGEANATATSANGLAASSLFGGRRYSRIKTHKKRNNKNKKTRANRK